MSILSSLRGYVQIGEPTQSKKSLYCKIVMGSALLVCWCIFVLSFGQVRQENSNPPQVIFRVHDDSIPAVMPSDSTTHLLLTANKATSGVELNKRTMLITHHGRKKHPETNNVDIYKYVTPKGSSGKSDAKAWQHSGKVMSLDTIIKNDLANLRSVLVVEDKLYIVSAQTQNSKVVVTKRCGLEARHAFDFTSNEPGTKHGLLNHPYGLAKWGDSLYATNQNSGTVVRMGIAASEAKSANDIEVVVNIPQPRGVAFSKDGAMWVASKIGALHVYENQGKSGKHSVIEMTHPVGVAYDTRTDLMYVSSVREGKHGGAIYVFNANTRQVVARLRPPKKSLMPHPAGMAIGRHMLYVVGQNDEKIYSFFLSNGTYNGVKLDKTPTRPEGIALMYCPH